MAVKLWCTGRNSNPRPLPSEGREPWLNARKSSTLGCRPLGTSRERKGNSGRLHRTDTGAVRRTLPASLQRLG
jgi:hypothetical protein